MAAQPGGRVQASGTAQAEGPRAQQALQGVGQSLGSPRRETRGDGAARKGARVCTRLRCPRQSHCHRARRFPPRAHLPAIGLPSASPSQPAGPQPRLAAAAESVCVTDRPCRRPHAARAGHQVQTGHGLWAERVHAGKTDVPASVPEGRGRLRCLWRLQPLAGELRPHPRCHRGGFKHRVPVGWLSADRVPSRHSRWEDSLGVCTLGPRHAGAGSCGVRSPWSR